MTAPIRLAVLGAGVMGANHVRVAKSLEGIELIAVIDQDIDRAAACGGEGVQALDDMDSILDQIDAAVVAVPTALHFSLASQLIKAGKSVLVEKPIALDLDEARAMVDAATQAKVVLAVGHIERFNAAVAELPRLTEEPIHIRAERISPYSPRISDGVVMDLMIHDLDIVLSLVGPDAEVVSSSASAVKHRSESEDIATALVGFSNGVSASFTTSRLGQQKSRTIEITEADAVVTADLLRQDVTIHRMSRHEYLADDGVRYRQSGVVEIPFLETRGEPLALELKHFCDCVRDGTRPRVSGDDGMRALALAQRIVSDLVFAGVAK